MSNKGILSESFVSESYAQGPDLVRCLKKIEEAIREESRDTKVSALYIMAVFLQAPNLSDEQMQSMVWELSKRMCLLLAGTDKPSNQEIAH